MSRGLAQASVSVPPVLMLRQANRRPCILQPGAWTAR